MKKLFIGLTLFTSITSFAEVFELPYIQRTEQFQSLEKTVWQKRGQIKARKNPSAQQNHFYSNEHSFNENELRALIDSYKDFFKKYKVNVEIDDRRLSQELILQVEALAGYIEDLLIMQKTKNPVDELTKMRSTRNLYGGIVINHKFRIKKGRKNKITFTSEKSTPVVEITYSNFIPNKLEKLAKKPAIPAHKSRFSYLVSPEDNNISRNHIRYIFSGWNGILITPYEELGFIDENEGFVHVMSYGLNSGTRVKDFMSPGKIDKAIVDKYFSRVCNGLGIVYKPSNLFISFPQTDIVKQVNSEGKVTYIQRDTGYVFKDGQLDNNPHLRRGYDDIITQYCSDDEVKKYQIEYSKLDNYTGINKEFLNYVAKESMQFKFESLRPAQYLSEVTCPVGLICERDGSVYHQSAPSRESLGKAEVFDIWREQNLLD